MTAVVLSLGVCALIVIMLLGMGALPPSVTNAASRLIAFQLPLPAGSTPARSHAAARARQASRQSRSPKPLPAPPPIPPLNMLVLTREEFAASDISKLLRHPADASADSGAGKDSGAASGPGEGPGGQHLYNAEWYREPTHAELVTYLPAGGAGGSWAIIACRTVERYHVEDCHELAESPAGSGLARALRRAAWQFLVRPPRIGGRAVIGSWVRIRFDFTHDGEK